MGNNETEKTICKSVFLDGEGFTSKTRFTNKWIELVNNIEKHNSVKFSKK